MLNVNALHFFKIIVSNISEQYITYRKSMICAIFSDIAKAEQHKFDIFYYLIRNLVLKVSAKRSKYYWNLFANCVERLGSMKRNVCVVAIYFNFSSFLTHSN